MQSGSGESPHLSKGWKRYSNPMNKIDTVYASRVPLYPPRVTPPPKPLNLPQSFIKFLSNPLLAIPESVYHEPLVVLRGPPAIAWVTDPALVKIVLLDCCDDFPQDPLLRRVLGPLFGSSILTSEGRDWRWQHQTVAPLFRHGEILRYVPAMVAGAESAIKTWSAAPPGSTHAIDTDMVRATYHVISNTLLAGDGALIGETMEQGAADYVAGLSWSMAYAALNLPVWLPRPGRRRMHFWESRLRAAVTGLIHARRASPDDRDDLFARLLGAVDPETSQTMSDEQLVDNLLTFLLAGHHTIAAALTWTLYLTSRASEWEARMLEEIRQVVPSGPVTGEHIDKLVTVQQVLMESLRLFPPLPVMSRYAAEDVELAREHIKAGTLIGLQIYVIHRHRELWDNPDRFDPSRFAPGRDVGYSRYQFMPFGVGPRICIGAAFALIRGHIHAGHARPRRPVREPSRAGAYTGLARGTAPEGWHADAGNDAPWSPTLGGRIPLPRPNKGSYSPTRLEIPAPQSTPVRENPRLSHALTELWAKVFQIHQACPLL
jgi:cytochrome P450